MIPTRIGVISDVHLFNKTLNIERALSKLQGVDLLLIVGDIADRAREEQYDLLLSLIDARLHGLPVYCVSGNHDNPARDDTSYRQFERKINGEYPSIVDPCGAFYKRINASLDLIGINPLYHQKQFFFPNRGQQLAFLKERLAGSACKYHIVMCHPPLIAHNPQRTADMASYITAEQDARLQSILDENHNVIFLSGHTHVAPALEFDEAHGNLYINDGSICPTTLKDTDAIQQGNVTLLDITEGGVRAIIKGIHTEAFFLDEYVTMDWTARNLN